MNSLRDMHRSLKLASPAWVKPKICSYQFREIKEQFLTSFEMDCYRICVIGRPQIWGVKLYLLSLGDFSQVQSLRATTPQHGCLPKGQRGLSPIGRQRSKGQRRAKILTPSFSSHWRQLRTIGGSCISGIQMPEFLLARLREKQSQEYELLQLKESERCASGHALPMGQRKPRHPIQARPERSACNRGVCLFCRKAESRISQREVIASFLNWLCEFFFDARHKFADFYSKQARILSYGVRIMHQVTKDITENRKDLVRYISTFQNIVQREPKDMSEHQLYVWKQMQEIEEKKVRSKLKQAYEQEKRSLTCQSVIMNKYNRIYHSFLKTINNPLYHHLMTTNQFPPELQLMRKC